ncbi:hypothetical protein B0H14DRAFT_3897149 [Mycena olivaceomarginata]|nr:hypothetical protein B0H14DRAFT_3897149 [Mycena olivaceomarginata]
MCPTRIYQADEPNPHPIPVETPLHPPMSSQSDAAAIHQSDRASATERGSNGCRAVINYISGGQGGNGGDGGLQGYGGAGGTGEGPTLQYDIKAERIVVKTFTSPEATPSDFLRIPLANIDLRSEIRVDAETATVWRHRERKSVRRMYSARVVGHNEPMTVALYQGHNADEEWKRDLCDHSVLRHPHILQIYASASSFGIHAVIFHDDLVLLPHFLDSFRYYSAVLTVYIHWYTNAEWSDACKYYAGISPMGMLVCYSISACPPGHLCVEFSNFYTDDGFSPLTDRIIATPPEHAKSS